MITRAVVFIFTLFCNLFSQTIDDAIYDLYNFRFDSAIEKLDELNQENPNDPLVPFLKISTEWQRSLLADSPEESYEIIYDGIDDAVPFYHEMIKRYPNDQNYRLFLGSLYGLKARIDLAQGKWMELIFSGARGFIFIDEARKGDPELHDVYMPIGTLEYFLCKTPEALQVIGNIFGLQSDCELAIEKLETASSKGRFSWVESRNVLSYAYLYLERDYDKALEVTSSLAKEFPGHPFFAYLYAEALVRLKKYEEYSSLESRLKSFYESGPRNQIIECRDKHLYIQAMIEYDKGDYEKAISLCDEIIEGYEIEFKWILGYAYFIKGKSLELSGDRASAIVNYKSSILYLEHYPEYKEAEILISTPISEVAGSTLR